MLSAAVRDLHLNFPGEFITDVRTSCPELWENNPNLTSLLESAPGVELLECHYPLINYANQTPYHSLNGFIEFLNNQLNIRIRPTEFHGDIHLSELEKSWFSQVHELTGADIPFWIIVAGGKRDITIKWWSSERFQEVVDHFRGRIQFVQVGETHHHHPLLDGVIDLRGKTDLRQLVRLVHHSQGVLCGVTAIMHLAAAVERKDTGAHDRPCVVVAGGREPPHWEAYPSHQFLHTVGMLPCSGGGCWRDRTQPLGDGDERDRPEHICLNVIGELPRCMDMITATDVIRSVERYFTGGAASYLTPAQATLAAKAVTNLREKVDRGSLPKNRTLSKPLESQLTANNSPLDRVEDRSELILVTLNDATMAPVAEITSARKRKYAVRHGYGFVHYEQLLDSTRHPAWNKLLAVREVLLTGRSNWVMWMDADALPMN